MIYYTFAPSIKLEHFTLERAMEHGTTCPLSLTLRIPYVVSEWFSCFLSRTRAALRSLQVSSASG